MISVDQPNYPARLLLKTGLIITYMSASYDVYSERLDDLGLSLGGVIYCGLFVLIALSLVSISQVHNRPFRFTAAILLSASVVLVDSYQRITSDFLTYHSFITLINAQAFIDDAVAQYFLPMVRSIFFALLLLLGIAINPGGSNPLADRFLISYPVLMLFLLTGILFFRGGDGAKGLPSAFTSLSYSLLGSYEYFNRNIGEREKVEISTTSDRSIRDIVLIIDESISAAYLDINSDLGVDSGLKESYDNIQIYNYGYAASATNCSTGTNVTLRYGGTRENYLSFISTKPSIWEYSKQTGMHTVYIDAQRTKGLLQNSMTDEETELIDEFIQFDDVAVVDRDIKVAEELIRLINNGTRDFILVNKLGAHFPVHDKYPDDFKVYKPTLPRGSFLNITDTGSRAGFSGSVDDWARYRNSYKNTILWNVGHFFSLIFNSANLDNATIIYTADHGQDLHEDGTAGLDTHCSSNPKIEEGVVPLVIIEGRNNKTLDWGRNLDDNFNKSSHYNIFPTLLLLMSYDRGDVTSTYGNSLDMKTNDAFTFNARFYSRLGKKPVWRKVDVNKIHGPINDSHF